MYNKQWSLHEDFVISAKIKDEVGCYRPSRGPRLIILTDTLIISDSTKTECNNIIVFLYLVLVKIMASISSNEKSCFGRLPYILVSYSRSSRERPPLKLEKVVATKACRLLE